jgi:hemerythrin-like domain-containing protein
MKVEENMLIPEVKRRIKPEQRGEISELFEVIEQETMGHGAHERYIKIIEQLAGRYGKKA